MRTNSILVKLTGLVIAILAQSCTTVPYPKYEWEPTKGASVEDLYRDSQRCAVAAAPVETGKFGNGKERAYRYCMFQMGHKIVEVPATPVAVSQ